MSKKVYTGVNNIDRNVNKIYVGVNNVARKVKKAYVGVNNVAQQFYESISYTPLNYLETTGEQYIDTNIVFNSVKIELKFQATNSSQTNGGLVGAYVSGRGAMMFGFNSSRFQFAYGGGWNGSYQSMDLNEHTAILNQNNQCLLDNNTLVTSSSISTSLNTNVNGFLFNSNGGAWIPKAKIFYCKIWNNNNELVRDFIPVLDSNNIPCMLDRVTSSFFYNTGTGSFLYG